jgi:hypothetical protein
MTNPGLLPVTWFEFLQRERDIGTHAKKKANFVTITIFLVVVFIMLEWSIKV